MLYKYTYTSLLAFFLKVDSRFAHQSALLFTSIIMFINILSINMAWCKLKHGHIMQVEFFHAILLLVLPIVNWYIIRLYAWNKISAYDIGQHVNLRKNTYVALCIFASIVVFVFLAEYSKK